MSALESSISESPYLWCTSLKSECCLKSVLFSGSPPHWEQCPASESCALIVFNTHVTSRGHHIGSKNEVLLAFREQVGQHTATSVEVCRVLNKTLESGRQEKNTFKILKKSVLKPGILYPAQLLIKNKFRISIHSDFQILNIYLSRILSQEVLNNLLLHTGSWIKSKGPDASERVGSQDVWWPGTEHGLCMLGQVRRL